ncbi:hypothetical protein E1B28_000298 [Marasmius oreades]|uniref:DUF6532 domain-containing protein n=1 Tax=Marasmius oreades TaxID=181124 RepID=A0A9P8AE73_9AGAR|nr:uncharacterized protein E1B28_000298 [Marasmius oreades]KAG7098337.1 hypothetical protein E1B28_000298 [Marasmius oreades]
MGTDSDLASDEERLFPQSIRPLNTITNSPSHRTVRKASDWPVVASSQKGQIVRPSDESPVRETVQLPSPSPTQPVQKFYRPQQPQSPSAHQAQSPSQRDHVNSSVNNDDDSDTPSVTDDHQQLELSRGSMGTKLRDYIGLSKQVVRKSLNNFEAGVIGYHMFPQPETAYLFVQDIWDSQNEFLTERGEKPFRLTNEVVRLMFRRSTRIRGACRGRIEPLIGPTFKFDTRYNSARVKQKNLQRYILLSTDFGWYYKDPENRIGYMKNSIIFDAICAVLYHNKRAHGVCGNPWLNPVQKPTIAFAFTIVEYCLEKWSTGVFVETEMDENALQPVYQKHLARVEEWLALDTKKTTKIREAWTARGLALVGVTSYDSAEEDVSMSREDRDNALRELQESDGCESDESNDSGYEHPQRTENRDGGQKGKGKAVETREACDDGLEMRETGGESESEPDIGQS